MKKLLMGLLILVLMLTCAAAFAEATEVVPELTYGWAALATTAGATAATLLVVQFIKLPLDKVWRIPVRAIVYLIALLIMIGASIFTGGFVLEEVPLIAINAVVVALAAMGSYELTFKKLE